jgi:hypothetical protein
MAEGKKKPPISSYAIALFGGWRSRFARAYSAIVSNRIKPSASKNCSLGPLATT